MIKNVFSFLFLMSLSYAGDSASILLKEQDFKKSGILKPLTFRPSLKFSAGNGRFQKRSKLNIYFKGNLVQKKGYIVDVLSRKNNTSFKVKVSLNKKGRKSLPEETSVLKRYQIDGGDVITNYEQTFDSNPKISCSLKSTLKTTDSSASLTIDMNYSENIRNKRRLPQTHRNLTPLTPTESFEEDEDDKTNDEAIEKLTNIFNDKPPFNINFPPFIPLPPYIPFLKFIEDVNNSNNH